MKNLTTAEAKTLESLSKRLIYGRGISNNEWTVLIPLRRKSLLARGKNPDHYNLDSRGCEMKMYYRDQVSIGTYK